MRLATNEDIPQLKNLFTETVTSVNIQDYSKEQVEDWASCGDGDERWMELLQKHQVFVCELDGQMAGYCSIDSEGYIHMMFTSKDYQRRGVARRMMLYLFECAKRFGLKTLSSNVSITAKPFFERFGFKMMIEQEARANKLFLKNYKMVNEDYFDSNKIS